MNEAVTKRFLYINSENRSNGVTSDFVVNVDNGQLQNCFFIVPIQFTFTNVFFNVNSESKIFKLGGITYTLPIGSYTSSGPNSLISAINNSLLTTGVTLAFSSLTGKVTFTSSSQFNFDYSVTQSNFLKLIGIRGTETSVFDGVNWVLKGLNIIDLRPSTDRIFLHLDMINNHYINNNESVLGGDVLLQINLGAFGEISTFENADDSMYRVPLSNGQNMSSFRLRVTNEHNETLDTFGAEYQLTMAVISTDY